MSNVIIPLEHQSSPKETDIDKQIHMAVDEIASGQFTPMESEDGWNTGTQGLAQHPRVIEAMAKLETQIQDKTNQEYLEVAQQFHELNEIAQMEKRWPGQQRWMGPEAEAMRKVNQITPFAFIRKLVAAGVSASDTPHVETGYTADGDGILRLAEMESSESLICLGRRVVECQVGVFANVTKPDGSRKYERVDKLQVPLGVEWDVLRFDEWGIPIGKRYHGWRTCLLALIAKGVITEEQAHKAFGPPIENAASSFYRQQLFELRNQRRG